MLLFGNNPLRLFSNNPLRISRAVLTLCHILILQLFLAIAQVIEKWRRLRKIQKHGVGDVALSCYNALKRGVTISIFYETNILSKISCQIVATVGVKHFHIVTHSYAASFLVKTSFCKTNNISWC